MMRKTISSAATPFFKFVFPTLWIGGFGIGTLVMAVQGEPQTLIFVGSWLVGASFMGLLALRLKRVELEDGNLVVSNYRRSVVVPVAAIRDIEERRLLNIHPVWVYLRHPTEFGSAIMFMPKLAWRLQATTPVVLELRKLAGLEGSQGIQEAPLPGPPKPVAVRRRKTRNAGDG